MTVTIITTVMLYSCENNTVSGDDLTGEWVDTEKADTIYVIDDTNFYHSAKNLHQVHYVYSIHGDSITIKYNGMLKIYVRPTTHYFKLKKDELMIDLTNRMCYGFPEEKMHYKRIQKLIIE